MSKPYNEVVIVLRTDETKVEIRSTYAEFFPDRVEGFSQEKDDHFEITVVDGDFLWEGKLWDFCSVYAVQ